MSMWCLYFDIFPTLASAAQAELPQGLIGYDLTPLIRNRQASPERTLFWEISNAQGNVFGVLSADARWRLKQDIVGSQALYDLQTSPKGDKDVRNANADVAQRLTERYLSWRRQQRTVMLDYVALNNQGHAMLTGSSLQRSPGYGGHTFAIGVTPVAVDERSVIASQENQWQLIHDPEQGIIFDIQGDILSGPVLPIKQCSAIVVTSHYHFSIRFPEKNMAVLDLLYQRSTG